jgi:hypothetical protein
MFMMRKILLSATLAGSLLLGGSNLVALAAGQAQTGKQTQQSTKSVTGKVAAIGSEGRSLTLEVGGESTAQGRMEFVLDDNAQVQGHVKQGTPVTVEYLVMESGKNLAVTITATA